MITEKELRQFIGTEHYYKNTFGLLFTDGVKYLADNAGAYWLIDAIESYHRPEHFQLWELHKQEGNKAVLTMKEDTNEPLLVEQEIPYTGFPLDYIKLYLIDGVLLLPSEY